MFFARSTTRRRSAFVPSPVSAQVETAERRVNPSATWAAVITNGLADQVVEPGHDDVVMAEVDLYASQQGVQARTLSYASQPGTDFDDIQSFDLRADLRDARGRFGRSDGVYETVVAQSVRPRGDSVQFNLGWVGYVYPSYRGLKLQVTADLADDASSQSIGLSAPKLGVNNQWYCGWWRGHRGTDVRYFGSDNPTHEIVAAEQSGSLSIVQLSLASTDTVVENQSDVALLAFQASADDVEDVLLTGATFTTTVGTASDVSVYSLWADTDGNGAVDMIVDNAISQNGNVVFDGISGVGYVVPAGTTSRFEVHGDMASSFASETFQLSFGAGSPVQAEAVDDGGILKSIDVFQTESTVFHLIDQGSLFVTQSSSPVRPQYLLGGTLSEAVSRLTLHAENEAIDVSYLGLNVVGSTGQSIDRFELYLPGAVTPFAIATRAAAGSAGKGDAFAATLSQQQLVVQKGSNLGVIVRARMKSDVSGGIAGEQIAVEVGNVEARGANSSNALSANDGDALAEGEIFIGTSVAGPNGLIVGTEHIVTMSRIASVTNANPSADGTAIPTGFANVGQHKFTADTNSNTQNGSNKVVIDSMSYIFVAVNVDFDVNGFALYNKANPTIVSTDYQIVQLTSSTWRITFANLTVSGLETEIGSGSDATFVLMADILSPKVDNAAASSLQVFADIGENGLSWLDRDFGSATTRNGLRLLDDLIESTRYNS